MVNVMTCRASGGNHGLLRRYWVGTAMVAQDGTCGLVLEVGMSVGSVRIGLWDGGHRWLTDGPFSGAGLGPTYDVCTQVDGRNPR